MKKILVVMLKMHLCYDEKKRGNTMENWQMVLTICGINVAIIGLFSGLMFWMFNKLDSDIKSLRNDMFGIKDGFDGWTKHFTAMQAQQSKRTDDLYNVILDMLKKEK